MNLFRITRRTAAAAVLTLAVVTPVAGSAAWSVAADRGPGASVPADGNVLALRGKTWSK